jgi:hypothetical protein
MAKTSWPIRRAIVKAVRDAPVYTDLNGLFHGLAPEKTEYPFATYQQIPTPYEDAWGSRMIIAVYDVFVFSRNEVEAHNLDQLLADALDGAQLTVEGMSTLICRRFVDVSGVPDTDEEGKQVFQVGGSYEVWTDQTL